jgi:hypothetical protein
MKSIVKAVVTEHHLNFIYQEQLTLSQHLKLEKLNAVDDAEPRLQAAVELYHVAYI